MHGIIIWYGMHGMVWSRNFQLSLTYSIVHGTKAGFPPAKFVARIFCLISFRLELIRFIINSFQF